MRATLRQTHSLPLVQKHAGWPRLQMAYLTVGDEEARRMVADMAD